MNIISRRFGEATNLVDFSRKAQMVNYETYRAIYEGFDSRLWNDCNGVLLWMSHPSWPSVVWQLYSWDYEPNAAYFGAKIAGEPVHVQMNAANCNVAVINHHFEPLKNAVVDATIYDLAGQAVQHYRTNLTADANACTRVFSLDWPTNGAYLAELKLFSEANQLISQNFYWHARAEADLKELADIPCANLTGGFKVKRDANATIVKAVVVNSSKVPALAIKLSLRDADTGNRILPAYYGDNYFSLLPGESREIEINFDTLQAGVRLDVDGWNVVHSSL
jgi:hypothetical protein